MSTAPGRRAGATSSTGARSRRGRRTGRRPPGARTRTGIWVVNSYAHGAGPPRWRDKLYGRALAAGDRIVAPSAYLAERLLERHPMVERERVVVIPRRLEIDPSDPPPACPARIKDGKSKR